MRDRGSDLVVLVPDKNMEAGVRGLLSRPQALGIHSIRHQIYVHPERDPGCFRRSQDFLRPMAKMFAHALVMFDRIGSGQEAESCRDLEANVTRRLTSAGWGDRAAAVVIDPELEAWVWSDSPHVERALGWANPEQRLRPWLGKEQRWVDSKDKPDDPKAAVERVLQQVRKPRSSALYEDLAKSVSFQRCTDPAFLRFRQLLATWFAQDTG